METMSFNGRQESQIEIISQLWEQYIGSRGSMPGDFEQRMDMLQESIRKTMRAEYSSYLAGHATKGRVQETKGHAILVGKIMVNWNKWMEQLEMQKRITVNVCS